MASAVNVTHGETPLVRTASTLVPPDEVRSDSDSVLKMTPSSTRIGTSTSARPSRASRTRSDTAGRLTTPGPGGSPRR
jgi:hypothetical protein